MFDMPRYQSALAYVALKHHDHLRKGTTTPYLSHLMSTSALVMEAGGTADQCIAALLHDTVEDRGGEKAAKELRDLFGDVVADIVLGCSDTTDKDNETRTWRERKRDYIRHVAAAPTDVHLVSCADKLHNARCILADYRVLGDALWTRFNADGDNTLWYYETLIETFAGLAKPPPHLDELRRTVAALRALMG